MWVLKTWGSRCWTQRYLPFLIWTPIAWENGQNSPKMGRKGGPICGSWKWKLLRIGSLTLTYKSYCNVKFLWIWTVRSLFSQYFMWKYTISAEIINLFLKCKNYYAKMTLLHTGLCRKLLKVTSGYQKGENYFQVLW